MRRTLGAVALALAIAGCHDRNVPVGTFKLAGSEGGALPLKLDSNDNCFHMLMGGQLRIERNATYQSVLNVEIACPGTGLNHRDIKSTGELGVTSDSLLTFQDTTGQFVGTATFNADSVFVVGPIHRLIFARQQ